MKKNDIITVQITAMTSEGSGVARYEGMAVFVPFTAVGDVISCRVVKVLKSYAFGRIEELVTASTDRIDNDCPAYGRCGGCCFRHISYEAELRAKESIVRDAFERIGGLSPEFLPIAPSPAVGGYRNKLQMPVARIDGRTVCGFYSERSHRVIAVDGCLLQPEVFGEITRFVTEAADMLHISAYNEEKHEGVLRHIFLRKGNYSGEICLCLVVRRKVPELSRLAAEVCAAFPQITGVVVNINPDRTNVILGEKELVLRGKAAIADAMCGVIVEISPRAFYQVNTPAAERLYEQAREFAQPRGRLVLDLYCGAGTIGLSMAGEAQRVIGAEIVPDAVENAKRNAQRSGFANAEFFCADAGMATERFAREGISPDVIMLDPPRKGCSAQTLRACAGMSPERIVMISCDPATAARDAKLLGELGYKAVRTRAFDLFPRTRHVECVTLLVRNAAGEK